MNTIFYMNISVFEDQDIYNKCMTLISEKRRNYIMQLKNSIPARLSLASGMLQRLVMEKYGYDIDKIKYAKYGKPYIDNDAFYFNISHSGEYAICVCSHMPVGIDLQKIKESIPKHIDKILTENEKEYLEQLTDMEKIKAFYNIWTMKETLIKLDGRGLRIPLENISSVTEHQLTEKIFFENKEFFWQMNDLLMPEYALCICSSKKFMIDEIKEITSKFLTIY